MAKRYSKNYSNYILKKKYQYTTKGTIWERDWVTIGAQHQIEKGKRPFFGDSGFLFTDNSFVSTQKRHEFGKVVAEWLYGDVKDTKTLVNKVEVNYVSDDLRDFAYYGSCVELVRSSIYNIINYFPGCAWQTTRMVKIDGSDVGYLISNPFKIDFITENLKEEDVRNPMRFMSLSGLKYEVIKYTDDSFNAYQINSYEIEWRSKEDIDADVEYPACKEQYKLADITIKASDETDNVEYHLSAYMSYGEVIITKSVEELFELRPVEAVIDEYFNKLEGFEKLLLRTDTEPLYSNTFLKMFETDNGIRYAYRDYVWPRVNDYCIDIESPTYVAFVGALIETSTEFDEMWCDNLWRNMTHESLRNYDWTYTKTFIPGDEQDNIDGGNRLEKLIRIYGRVFDDLKRYIDGIRFTAKVSYDGYNNMPNAELSDRLDYNGWEIFTTIPNFSGTEEWSTDEDLSTVYIDIDGISPYDWFKAVNPTEVTAATNDIDFLRTLSLSSKYIQQSKGTLDGVDMVMALFGIGSDIDERSSISGDEYDALEEEEKEGYELIRDDVYVKKSPRYSVSERYYVTNMMTYSEGIEKSIADLVHYDNQSYYYDDPYENVPFGNVELNNIRYIVPYYDSDKYYLGEFTFQSNGGWYKKSLDPTNLNDYEETLSYLNVVPTFESLFSVNTYSLDTVGENAMIPPSNIYYVVNPSDYVKYNENPPRNLSHFFYIEDIYNPQLWDSWNPILFDYIDTNDTVNQEDYENLSDEDKATYVKIDDTTYARFYPGNKELSARVKYLDNIISSNIGNNPHVGYGRYDLGQEFKSYMEYPFKYYEDNYVLPEEGSVITYSLAYDVDTTQYSSLAESITKEQYETDPYTHKEHIRFERKVSIMDIINMAMSGNSADFTIRINKIPGRRSAAPKMSTQNASIIDIEEKKQYVDFIIHADNLDEEEIGAFISAVNNANTISYDEYMDLSQTQRRLYRLWAPGLLQALSDRSPVKTDEYNFNLQELYSKDNKVFSDFTYDLTEYETINKVKNISNIYYYAKGYASTLDQEHYDALDPEEKKAYRAEILTFDDNGDPIFQYVKTISEDEWKNLPQSEQSDYKETIIRVSENGQFRDKEDATNDTPIGIEDDQTQKQLYYLNSKLIKIEFKNTNQLFKRYFLDVIGKYLMQVIPSTAIVVVIFDCDNIDNNEETEEDNG